MRAKVLFVDVEFNNAAEVAPIFEALQRGLIAHEANGHVPDRAAIAAPVVANPPPFPSSDKAVRARRVVKRATRAVATEASEGRRPSLKNRVLEHLAGGQEASCKDIGEALDVSPSYVSQQCSKLMADGRLTQVKRGVYQLAKE